MEREDIGTTSLSKQPKPPLIIRETFIDNQSMGQNKDGASKKPHSSNFVKAPRQQRNRVHAQNMSAFRISLRSLQHQVHVPFLSPSYIYMQQCLRKFLPNLRAAMKLHIL